MNDSLGTRMKGNYEHRSRTFLTRRTPVIMRLDGKAFHTLTRDCGKPFDGELHDTMVRTAIKLCEEIQGAVFAYTQSDEISILIQDWKNIETQAWFDYNVQKMTSISAAIASVEFSLRYGKRAYFDSRVFNIPREEVNNYFVWRQKDWERNSVFMLANAHYSAAELHEKSNAEKHEMLYQKGINWADCLDWQKNGTAIVNGVKGESKKFSWFAKDKCPIFTYKQYLNSNFIDRLIQYIDNIHIRDSEEGENG